MPLPTVAATLSWNTNKATKLKNAANATAWCGLSTPVDTTVAIELAASWKPFMKSKASASATSSAITQNPSSTACIACCCSERRGSDAALGVLEDHALDQIGHVLAAVGDRLQVLVHRLQLDQLARVDLLVAEHARDRRAHHAVGIGLQAVDLLAGLQRGLGHRRFADARQQAHCVLHTFAALDRQVTEADHVVVHRLHVV